MAASLGQIFAEILEQGLPPTAGLLAIAEHRLHLVMQDAFVLFVGVALRHHLFERDDILHSVGHPGVGGFAVAAGTAGLLVVGF